MSVYCTRRNIQPQLIRWHNFKVKVGTHCRDLQWGQGPSCVPTGRMFAGKVRKLVHWKRILVHFYIVAGTVCESSVHRATLKIEAILSLLHDPRIQISWISRNMLLGQNLVPATARFCKNGQATSPVLVPLSVTQRSALGGGALSLRERSVAWQREGQELDQHVTRGKLSSQQVPSSGLIKMSRI